MKRPPLRSFALRNFKAVRDSGTVNFGPLTALIGNNGSGKSSLIEGLEAFSNILQQNLDAAMRPFRGMENVWNKAVARELRLAPGDRQAYTNPVTFVIVAALDGLIIRARQSVTLGEGYNSLFIVHENATVRSRREGLIAVDRDAHGRETIRRSLNEKGTLSHKRLVDGESCLTPHLRQIVDGWQFLSLSADAMGQPLPQQRAGGRVRLARNGANIAEYLNEIRQLDVGAFNGILEALRTVLPYAADLQPALTSELERAFYLKLKEQQFEVPGWLLSTGTLRIAALLACLRHPSPPSLLVIEEIENGLDPRTIHMLVEEIRAAIDAGKTQIILTTHSPYLLDLLDLSHIVVVERVDGEPVFERPDPKQLKKWAESFSPGRLYTMGKLTKGD